VTAQPQYQLRLATRPKSRLGTPAHTGPYSRLRLDSWVKAEQGITMMELVFSGHSFRTAAGILGLSLTTAWRRYWFALDWLNGGAFGEGPPPHQRGTRACPKGRPALLPRDSDEIYRELLAAGATNETIANSHSVLPNCIRAHARWALICERLDPDTGAFPLVRQMC
jgi:hypothetical protein